MSRGGNALLVIDMIRDFSAEGGALASPQVIAIVPKVNREILRARERGWPVAYIVDSHHEHDAEFAVFEPHGLTPKGRSLTVDGPEKGTIDVVIPKRRYSAFFGSDLDTTLREWGASDLTVVGNCTNICVLYTVADARNLGYQVTVIADAVASFDVDAHEYALGQMRSVLGVTIRSGERENG